MKQVPQILEQAEKALEHDLCDHCLGRIFAHVDTGLSNQDRGRSVRMTLNFQRILDGKVKLEHQKCWVCEDVFDNVERFADAAIDAMSRVEYHNFLIGCRVDPTIQEREERVWSEVGQDKAEPIKAELNQEIGKLIQAKTKKEVCFETPEVVALIDTRFCHVELSIAPLFIYGRYHKYSREIPQTKWPCRECRGKGCPRCKGTGKMYQISVQEVIGDPILKEAEGREHFFHGMGREDIDARMLGSGRPFVLEIAEPKIRDIDLEKMQKLISESGAGLADAFDLRFSTKAEVRRVKMDDPEKVYLAHVTVHGKVNKEKVNEVVHTFKHRRISQQTPVRVVHRRADLDREREIIDASVESFDDDVLVLRLRTQSGTYVKELVSGDGGRTKPNLAEELGVPCQVTALDVVEIIDITEV